MTLEQYRIDNGKPPLQEPERMKMRLNGRDSKVFAAALLDAPEPGERLKAAYENYKRRIGAG